MTTWAGATVRWQIWCGDLKAHRVNAETEEEAISVWLNDQAMDCIEQAAREFGCEPSQIYATEIEA